jgi:hypothetical protein
MEKVPGTRTVEVSITMTINLGNYESAKVSSSLEESFLTTRDRDSCLVELFDAQVPMLLEMASGLKDQIAAAKG